MISISFKELKENKKKKKKSEEEEEDNADIERLTNDEIAKMETDEVNLIKRIRQN